MPAALKLAPHLTAEEIAERYESAVDPVEMRRWLALLWKTQGKRHGEIAALLNRKPTWVTQVIHIYNKRGPDGMTDQRVNNGNAPLLTDADGDRIIALLNEEPPQGGVWTGLKLKAWIEANLDVDYIGLSTVYETLQRLGLSWKLPRPQHIKAEVDAQEALKKGGSPRRWSR